MHLSTMIDWRHALLGVVLTLACSLAGQSLAALPGFSLIGHLVLALLLGMVIQVCRPVTLAARESTGFIANKFLRAGIIFLGFKLNLIVLVSAGLQSLEAAVFVVAIMIPLNYAAARFLRVDHTLALLTACGCSICGAAAVMGVSGALKAKADQSVLAVAIVAILGTVFTLIEVFAQPILGFTDSQFGVMAGLSLHEIAHAVAAGGSAGPVGTDSAIIAKLSRVLLLAPVAIILGIVEAWRQRRQSQDRDQKFKVPIPWFMGGFIVASAIGSYIPAIGSAVPMLVKIAYLILGMAMAALGLNVNFSVIAKEGVRPMVSAITCSFVILGLSWFIVHTWF
ncbi:MAG: putative sulfate exporter family transporter [Megasphaera elsdenii]|uniref:YeiH family protein n=1 Tax=Megasphaera elsdenii TaxID=907 RepID=UPI001472D99F|nr:putative sulfate exporter family transporter [Megasphaera elsdenii]MDD7156327.1 putative sulfate exporter family transporter [Megasphaera elsdenii]MDY3269716.1 putative sulfate exporter family transporter [Megasphaera elsdenii]NME19381.1 putative sulfate exporter family transporter [Megasphaera elsdenii]